MARMAGNGSRTMRVGDWAFDPSTGELRRGDELRRVEPRAARALELLCEADGGVVRQEEFVAKVWDGRALSENSLSVVIGQLRRALDDDPREPRIVETIPKRGYRLRSAGGDAAPVGRTNRHRGMAVAALAIAALLAIWAWSAVRQPAPLAVAVLEVTNETGNPRHAPLARATSELLVDRLTARGYAVNRGRAGDLELRPKLIMWDGRPFLSLSAVDRQGTVRWSAMLDASPGEVPPNVNRAFDELLVQFPPADGAERVAKGQ
jgi:DNA-binding winged helix-turn-helix (wHTH) protein